MTRIATAAGAVCVSSMAFAQTASDNASRPIGSGFGDGTSQVTNNSGISTPGATSTTPTTSTQVQSQPSTYPSQWITPNGVVIIQGGVRPQGETRLPTPSQGSVVTPSDSLSGGVPTGALGGGVPGASGRSTAPVRSGGGVLAQ